MRQQVAVLVDGAALDRNTVPNRRDRILQPRRAIDDEELGPPQATVTIGSGHDDLRSNPYTAKKRTVDPAQPPLLRQDARASLAERDLARETTQARLGRPGHRVTAD